MLGARRVLVVDDDAVVGRSISRVLGGGGYQVRETLSGSEALEELRHQRYDLVFTDLRMPGLDGLEVASRVRREHPGLPVVVVTGYGSERSETRARDLGVAAFLRKPLTPEMILDNAHRAMGEREKTAEAVRRSAASLQEAAPDADVSATAVARNVALFFAAPFVGLAYIVVAPFVGLWTIAACAARAFARD
jgi:CheY-like chemotaxis protein